MDMLLQHFKTIFDRPEKVKKLRELILQLAVRGKLVEQDENDEPASVLLERIREEKERLIKEKKTKKEKPLSEISEEEKPYELPKGWEWVRLGAIGSWGAGATPSRNNSEFYNGNINWLKTGELNDSVIKSSEEKITELALEKCSLRLNKPGDILIAMYGATIGKLGILECEATTNQACCGCTPYEEVYNKYLFNLLLAMREEFKSQGAGGAQPNISRQKIINTIAPLPPLNEQKRIVEKVNSLMAFCDELEKELERKVRYASLSSKSVFNSIGNYTSSEELEETLRFIIENFKELTLGDNAVKELKNAILQLAVQGKLVPQNPNDEPASVLLEKIKGEKERIIKEKKIKKEKPLAEISEEEKPYKVPNEWTWSRIGTIFTTTSGSTPSRSRRDFYDNGIINWVKTRDLNNNLVVKCEEKISEIAYEECNLAILPKFTICIAMYGGAGTIGKCGILGLQTTINQSVCGILPSNLFDYKFLYYFTLYTRPYWMNYASGSRIDPNINRNIIKNMLIPVPPLAEQKRIVEKVDSLMAICDELEKRIEKSKKYSEKLMEAILKDAFM